MGHVVVCTVRIDICAAWIVSTLLADRHQVSICRTEKGVGRLTLVSTPYSHSSVFGGTAAMVIAAPVVYMNAWLTDHPMY
jgi:hypothetical protein